MSIRHSLLLLQPLDTGSIELIVAPSDSVQESDAVGTLSVSAEIALADSESIQEAVNVILDIEGSETLIIDASESVQESTTPVVTPDIHLIPAVSESVLESPAVVVVTKSTVAINDSETTQEAVNVTLTGVGELFTTDFSEYTTGVDLSDWTDFWSAGNVTFKAELNSGEANPIGTKQCEYIRTSGDVRTVLTWDDVGTPTDVEVLAKLHVAPADLEVTGGARIYVRVGGSGASEDSYYFDIRSDLLAIGKYASGISSNLATTADTLATDTVFLIRFNVVGTAIKVKIWEFGAAEPGSWTLETTDSTHTSGAVGFGGVFAITDFEIDYFAADTTVTTIPVPSPGTDLIVDSSEQTQEAENVVVRLGGVLSVASSEQVQEAGVVVLITKSLIALLNSEQLQESSTPIVFQVYHISVDSSESLQESPQVPLVFATGTLTITITLR